MHGTSVKIFKLFFLLYRACSDIYYTDQRMHLVKYNKIQYKKTQFMTSIKLLHVSVPECHHQEVY